MNKTKLLIGSLGSLGILTLPLFAGAAGNIITLPVNFIPDALAYVGDIFTDLSLVILLVIGLPLGFWVIRKTISLVRAR